MDTLILVALLIWEEPSGINVCLLKRVIPVVCCLLVGRFCVCVCDYASLFARSTVLPLEVPRRLTQRSPNNAAAPCARGRRLGPARPGPLPPGGAAWAGSSSVLVLGGHRLQSWCLGGPPQAVRRLALIRVVAPAPSCSAVVKIQTS